MATTKTYATGRRKTSVARVFLNPNGNGKISINKRDLEKYFPELYWETVRLPLKVTETLAKYDIFATVRGGGLTGQAEALRHGIARALDLLDKEKYHKVLKEFHFLTRDSRMVQRKHFGLKKARKASQYSKR
jgi:small subunit ribosomal protein S9